MLTANIKNGKIHFFPIQLGFHFKTNGLSKAILRCFQLLLKSLNNQY